MNIDDANDDPMPRDPDWQDTPQALRDLDGQTVRVFDADDGTRTTETLVVVPGLHGHARRLRDRFYDENDDGGMTQ